MGATFVVHWRGDQVEAKVRYATRWGMDSVMADCVTTSKSMVPRKTTKLQGSIQMRPAEDQGSRIVGYWGSFAVKYARWVEEGTGPHVILPNWPGADHPVRMVYHPGTKPHPYLVPSAQMHYPSLALRIGMQLRTPA